MSRIHVVKHGEYLTVIAKRYGFRNPSQIYEDATNAEFRRKRPNPNVLLPGDTIAIPDVQVRPMTCVAGRRHQFVVKATEKDELIVILRDHGVAVANQPCTIEFRDPQRSSPRAHVEHAATGPDGRLSVPLPDGVTEATIVVIARSHLTWSVAMGHLDPVRDKHEPFDANRCNVSAVQSRLHNLGFACGAIDDRLGPRTRAALASFQEEVLGRRRGTGMLDEETCNRLEAEHGC